MTTNPTDARPSCFVMALDTIRAAQRLKLEPGKRGRVREKLPELYWSLMAEAAIYAELAKAPTDVGIAAGSHVTHRDETIRERRRRIRRDVAAKLAEKRPGHVPDLLELDGDPVRVIVIKPDMDQAEHHGRTGVVLQNQLSADAPPRYLVALDPDGEQVWFDRDQLDLVIG